MALRRFWCCILTLFVSQAEIGPTSTCPPACTCDESAYTCVAINATSLHSTMEELKKQPVGLLHIVSPSVTKLPAGLLHGLDAEGLVISANLAHLDHGTFTKTRGLVALSLAANALLAIPELPPHLHRLDLSDNRLTSIEDDAFVNITFLKSLQLDGNPLKIFGRKAFAGLTQLERLGLSRCQLVSPPSALSSLAGLRILDLSHNLMETLPDHLFSSSSHLHQLHLNHNRLRELPTYAFSSLPNLSELHLAGNHLTFLPHGGVGATPLLTMLDLSGNWLRSISAEGVGQTPHLRQLLLRDNAISWIHADAFAHLQDMETLEIEDNLLHCDCTLQGFASWLLSHSSLLGRHGAVCQEPPELQGHSIVDLTLAQMHCSSTTDDPYFLRLEEMQADVTWWKEPHMSQVHVAWEFSSPPIPYECDSVFVAEGEELRKRMPVSCDSTKLADPSRVLVDVDMDLLVTGSRLCLVLRSHSHPRVACSFLNPQPICPLKLDVRWMSRDSTRVNWGVVPSTTSLCKVTATLHLSGEVVANISVSCDHGTVLLPGISASQTDAIACLSLQAPYSCPDVCSPVHLPTSTSSYVGLGLAMGTLAMVFLIAFVFRQWCLKRKAMRKNLEPWPSLLLAKDLTSSV